MSPETEEIIDNDHHDVSTHNQEQTQLVPRNQSVDGPDTATLQPQPQQTQVQQARTTSWFFWSSLQTVVIEETTNEDQAIEPEEDNVQPQIEILETQPYAQSEQPSLPSEPQPTWWQSIFTSKTTEVNNSQPTPKSTPSELQSETAPLLLNSKETHHLQQPQNTWWGWLTGSRTEEDHEDEENTSEISNLDLYKSAKATIESSKFDSHHYIFKNTVNCKSIELSVFNSLTESNPVVYSSRKRPLLATEVLENSISNGANRQDSISSIGSFNPDSSGNIVTPLFEENYRRITLKTKLRIYSDDLLCGHKSEFHLYKEKNITKRAKLSLQRIIIIGVHSFLPNKMVRALIGANTGNAKRFVNNASKAVINWLKANNPEFNINDYEIETLAIEGEGKINDRIEKSIQLMKNNWLGILESSDFIFMTSYGTSCNLAVNLFAQMLIEFTGLQNTKYLGLLCLNGNLSGPVVGIESKLVVRAFTSSENEIIKELFEFNNCNSKLSNQLTESLKVLIDLNVKITFTGDMNDLNFIPLSSSLGLQYNHPNIRRNIYWEGDRYVPFVSSVLSILCLMRNLGYYNDYGLIKDLCDKLYSNLQPTTAASTTPIYLAEKAYNEAIRFTLESTNLIHKSEHDLLVKYAAKSNPDDNFYNLLPWNLRSFFHDLMKVKHINNLKLVFELIEEFNNWTPLANGNKNFKELKYCLSFLEDFEIAELLMS